MSLQHDELLAEESVFEDQFRLAAGKVQDGVEGQGLVVWFGPKTETLLDITAQSIEASVDEGQQVENHGVLSWSTSGSLDYTIKSGLESKNITVSWLLCHNPQGLVALVD